MRVSQTVLLLALLVAAPLAAQVGGRDPLNPKETDELRELAQEPDKRLKLMVKFARARLDAIEQLRGDPKLAADRGPQVHDLLEDFTKLIDELDDNIDDYAEHHNDLRKPLKDVIEGETDFQLKLRTLKEQAGAEVSSYNFVLQNAMEAVNASLDDCRKLLAEQEAAFKEEKSKKKK